MRGLLMLGDGLLSCFLVFSLLVVFVMFFFFLGGGTFYV